MKEQSMHVLVDEDLEAWDQFVTAVRFLSRHARPGLSLTTALQEALTDWVGEQAALTNSDEPFDAA
jgi:hypothetical protein